MSTGGGLAGMLAGAGMGQYASTTPTLTAYPPTSGLGPLLGGQAGYTSVYQPAYPVPTFPNDLAGGGLGLIGIYRVRKLENGYLVESAPYVGGPVKEYFCETLKDVGERIAALGVQKALEGGKP